MSIKSVTYDSNGVLRRQGSQVRILPGAPNKKRSLAGPLFIWRVLAKTRTCTRHSSAKLPIKETPCASVETQGAFLVANILFQSPLVCIHAPAKSEGLKTTSCLRELKEVSQLLSKSVSTGRSRPEGPGADNDEFRDAWLKSYRGYLGYLENRRYKNQVEDLLSDAESILEDLLQETPQPPLLWRQELAETRVRLGRWYRKRGQWQEASHYFEKGIDEQNALVIEQADESQRAILTRKLAFFLKLSPSFSL